MDQHLGSSSKDILIEAIPGGRNLSTRERESLDLSKAIPGWGSDLDPDLRPGVPRDKAPWLGGEHLYPAIAQQETSITIFKSTEHAKLTPVFGTSCPPKGLSGWIRGIAYRISEGRVSHWVLLLFADRVDMVEGILGDLLHLRIPNVWKEMGLGAEMKHNRRNFLARLLMIFVALVAIVSGTVALA